MHCCSSIPDIVNYFKEICRRLSLGWKIFWIKKKFLHNDYFKGSVLLKWKGIDFIGSVHMHDINLFLALGAGFMSFISPCCLPLYPAFLSYITGMSIGELQSENAMLQKRSLLHT